jgi:hypothetical protein
LIGRAADACFATSMVRFQPDDQRVCSEALVGLATLNDIG